MTILNLIKARSFLVYLSLATLVAVSGVLLTSNTAHAAKFTAFEEIKVVKIPTGVFSTWLGKPIADYSLMSVQRGRLRPIAFQIDNTDERGDVYFKESGVDIVGDENLIDSKDQLLFMLRDGNAPIDNNTRLAGKVVGEISLELKSGELVYVYIVKGSRLSADERYVRYAFQYHRVETDYFTLTHSKENALIWEDYDFFAYDDPRGNTLDRLVLKLSMGPLLPFPRLNFDNEDIIAKMAAENNGPIRATTLWKVTLKFWFMPVYSIYMHVHYYASSIEANATIVIPFFLRVLMHNPTMTLAIDNDLPASSITTSHQPGKKTLADGDISKEELSMLEGEFDPNNAWIWANTGQNYEVFNTFLFPDGNRDIKMKFFFRDELHGKGKSERFEGKLPETGYTLFNIPMSGATRYSTIVEQSTSFDYTDGNALREDVINPPNFKVRQID